METVIQTSSLTKQYQGNKVVSELDLSVPAGSIYGFLGPNGAGKSTTMKMILGLVKPSEGNISVLGKTVSQKNRLTILQNTGSLIESPAYLHPAEGVRHNRISLQPPISGNRSDGNPRRHYQSRLSHFSGQAVRPSRT